MKKYLALISVLILALFLRLYKIDLPLADHHSWRQADTAAVARNFIKEGWNFFQPKIDNFTPLHPGQPNDQRLFLVEPPIYNSLVAGIYKLLGVSEKWARLVSVIFSLGSMVFLYLLGAYFFNDKTGLFAALFFAILPYNIFYSRVILPEPMIIFLCLGMLFFAIKWLESDSALYYLLFIIFSAVSFTQKVFPLFLNLPLFYLIWRKFSWRLIKQRKLYLWAILAFGPFLIWRWYTGQRPEGVPANLWLFNENNIRFKGAFFNWIFAERIAKLILGFWGLPLLVLGMALKPKKEDYFLYFWSLSMLIFIFVFAAGNVTHDYYQIPLIPIFCLFLAKGANFLLFERDKNFDKILSGILFIVCFLLMFAFSWYQVRDFYNIQSGVDLAGHWIDENTAKDSLILTGDSNDATLLYNSNRWGWSGGYASNYPNEPGTIEQVKLLGATYYVATKFNYGSDFGKYMLKNYPVLKQTNQFIVFSLKDKNQ